MFKNANIIRLVLGLAMAAFTYFSYLSKSQVNPITGEKQHISLSPAEEVAMGLQSAPAMAAEFGGLLQDERVQNAVSTIGNKLVNSSEAKNAPYKFQFHVLQDPNTVNAFALPGGQIFITVGLLKRLESDDQVAGVLGHEIGHVVGRHSAEQMAKQELTQGLVNASQVATYDPYNPQTSQIAAYIGNAINLKYGREDELESDHFGVKYTHAAGYDPRAMIRVMEILAEAAGGSSNRQSEFMSSHPSPENRIAKIKAEIEQLRK